MKFARSASSLAAVVVVSTVSIAPAAVKLFDDTTQNNWYADIGQTETANVYSGSSSLKTGIYWSPTSPQIVLKNDTDGGTAIGSTPILQFYVNTQTNTADTLYLRINGLEFHPNGGGVYLVDGVTHTGGTFITDSDNSTWQKVQFDLTQDRWYWGNGFEKTNLTSASKISNIRFGESSNFIVDEVEFTAVPEPTALAAIGLAGLLGLRRRRESR
jgi:hypothetical protein